MPDNVLELRQYTLHPGQRDVLVDLFDREFVESQEEAGASILGQFRDLDDPDRFVWLRGFADMPSRAAALAAFYRGPAWKAHRDAANATMIDSDDVLLLRPVDPRSGFDLTGTGRPPAGTGRPPAAAAATGDRPLVIATICHLDGPLDERLRPALAGPHLLGCFETEPAENTFPALPVRADANVFVWFSAFADTDTGTGTDRYLSQVDALAGLLPRRVERLRLSPTPRSLLPARR
jgi:quinol monooxygenase YgiN